MLQALQPKRSIHTTHIPYFALFFCFSQSPSAFPTPKYMGFYGNKTRHRNGQKLVTSLSAERKCNLNNCSAIYSMGSERQWVIILCTCVYMCSRGRLPVHARMPCSVPSTHMQRHWLHGAAEGFAESVPSYSVLI